ncbi:hypothetical protein [Methylobacterium sp. A52T]
MPTYWHKQSWWSSDLDRTNPYKPEIVPGALPPGIYCEDEDAFRALQRGARTRGATFDPGINSGLARLDGMAVYVATPEQARLLQAVSAKEPSPPAPDPYTGFAEQVAKLQAMMVKKHAEQSYEDGAAEYVDLQEREARSFVMDWWRARQTQQATNTAAPLPATRHPAGGANRQQRRAAEAKRRRA